MKKTLRIAAAAAGILFLAGCGKQVANNNQAASGTQNQKQEQNRSISSIADAMGLGKTMRCTYRVKAGDQNMEMVTYVEGKKYRTEMNFNGMNQVSVSDGEAMYLWNKGEKAGHKIAQECMEELRQNAPEDSEEEMSFSAQDKNFENALDVKCEEIGSADFSAPADVVFTDQCVEMKKIIESVKNANMNMKQNGMPAGMPQDMPENMPENMPSAPQLIP